MKEMSYFKVIMLVVGALTTGSLWSANIQPNILFIFADDWGWGDLSCHGHPYVKTPNIDKLAAEGADFYRFTVASGVCSPSRTAVMTGHFPARHNINGHFALAHQNAARNMPDWLDPDAVNLPRLLKDAGYMTAHYGKWHLSNDMIPDGPLPMAYGYDDYSAYNCAGVQMPYYEDADNAINFIQEAKREGKPFFINLWMHEPHTPFHTLPKYRWPYREMEEEDEIYASVLAHADDRIGKLLDALDRMGLSENTLVIFSSDNGPARNSRGSKLDTFRDSATGVGYNIAAARGTTGGRRGYKASLLEGGIGVPFIARWPGKIPAGKTDRFSILSAVDLLPTFCELAGAELPDGYEPDGISQVEALLGTPYPLREKPLFWKFNSQFPPTEDNLDHWVSYAVVHGRWKLVTNKDTSYHELYVITEDPFEQNDLKDAHPEVAASMLRQLEEWQRMLPSGPDPRLFSSERKNPKK